MASSLVFVAGARPNFVKIAPILRAFTARGIRPALVHTGQHYDFAMSDVFFEQLGIPPADVHLQVGSGSHAAQTAAIMMRFEEYLNGRSRPRGVVVVGDVNSTMACSLVAAKLGIPVAHVESGLRSFDREMPEEINRIVTDAISDLLLVSEPSGLVNLAREGVPAQRVRFVGNVMIDTLVAQLDAARSLSMPGTLRLEPANFAIVTFHRPSNVDSVGGLARIVALLDRIATRLPVVFPVHPRTEANLRERGMYDELARNPAIKLSAPLGYHEFLGLMADARLVVTDSGGIQEETTFLGVPCVTMRANTERPVTLTHGTNVLVGDDLDAAWNAIVDTLARPRPSPPVIDGWDGRAAERIADVLCDAWGLATSGSAS